MKILELKDIQSDDIPLYYRRKYSAVAVLEIPLTITEIPVKFTIETAPTGKKDIEVDVLKIPDYPLIPVLRALKQTVTELEQKGSLPC